MSNWIDLRRIQVVVLLLILLGRPVFADSTDTAAAAARPIASDSIAVWLDRQFAARGESGEPDAQRLVDDGTYLRRVYLDLAGRIPAVSELRDFMADSSESKRSDIVESLLSSDQFGEHFSQVWRRVLLPPEGQSSLAVVDPTEQWLARAFNANKPYDKLSRELIVAGGAERPRVSGPPRNLESNEAQLTETLANQAGAAGFLASSGGSPAAMASSVSRVFLGVRLECAQCHDHPFTDWNQQDFWGVAAFFSGTRLVPARFRSLDEDTEDTSVVDVRSTTVTDDTGKTYHCALPWDGEGVVSIPEDQYPREFFANWLTSRSNPHFAATAVNRIWEYLCGRGLTLSVDDLDLATSEERLVVDGLAERFVSNGFDVKDLIRSICASEFYQRSVIPASSLPVPGSRPLKVLTPEQLFNSLEVALALPISSIDRGPRFNGQREAFVSRMMESLGATPSEFRSGIPQALMLMNGKITADATDLQRSRTLRAVVDAPFLEMSEKVDTLFLATLSRPAHPSEKLRIVEMIESRRSEKEKADGFSEIMWGLINSPEFVLVR